VILKTSDQSRYGKHFGFGWTQKDGIETDVQTDCATLNAA